ncbi:DNA-binding response regulator [Dyadobacter beijingensis]|uniref:DNA-binding response regulator n=1 Tax=Dyadobacter beijingensis TaxID=365489 RepID=A0ABQ2IEA2_9BACT|nr:response regulator [Dyadobacter beijingensis]GGN07275.1 DNA-binding response regulator [Dyadobacter beijingensis]
MGTAYIIDDEPRSAELLKAKILDLTDHFAQIECFNSPVLGCKAIWEKAPDILFLDIQMPLLNGIDLLENIKNLDIPIVYVTAFTEYSITAIKQQVFDYILKPVKEQELLQTIIKFIGRQKQVHAAPQPRPSFGELLSSQLNKISIPTSESINLVAVNQITLVMGVDNYSMFHFTDGSRLLSSKTLKHYEHQLIPFGFIRPHRSYLINTVYVDKVLVRDGGYLLMRTSELIPISRDKKPDIFDWFRI